jgi:hypothetical protein
VFGERAGVPPVVAAMLALGMLLASGVLDWRSDCLKGSSGAWDTLFWFSGGDRDLTIQGPCPFQAPRAPGRLEPLELKPPRLLSPPQPSRPLLPSVSDHAKAYCRNP